MKIYFETFGCSANQASAETMRGIIRNTGFDFSSEAEADVYVCNSCTVKYTTEQKILHKIRQFGEQGKDVIVCGCMPEVQLDLILNANPEAFIVGVRSVNGLRDVLLKISGRTAVQNAEAEAETKTAENHNPNPLDYVPVRISSASPDGFLNLPKIRYHENIHICQISTGCRFGCSYCIVRLARGDLISFPPEEIVRDVQTAVAEGCSEIWLTSQDDSQYGMDFSKESPYADIRLPALLKQIADIPGDFKIRVGMMNPFSIKPILSELIDAFNHPKIYKFLHIPIQSASEDVLKTMNRHYSMKDVDEIIAAFKERFPDLTLFTDIIVGFCGETDADFEETTDWVQKYKPDKINISKYSPRPGTKAFPMRNLDSRILTARSRELTELTDKLKQETKNERIGNIEDVFISKYGKESGVLARTADYKPVVLNEKGLKPGMTVKAKIVEATPGYFIGELVQN
ncbi:tRNA-2-methylthio-N(6)-dimethylallyladenosine synthase [Methanimicrococcus sp. At1]|uniref:tRNA-t(6)A37 methylthiotransferase n=1 Tax=Methanimicrococcus hacksteinii TaxID=3028293 RepID=A0ABU3VQB0_9EURY|nr:tRNA (N(6)-L-threonylcarbamoyladenosine(37)-C(2))-methylthiotransferase [Methanimicrococcus sp. At1]MDV0445494.1 tRNA-2-methylthio-N(6)-dimethylallyladenosine synthase [Methanimicrococcus sp. At1]